MYEIDVLDNAFEEALLRAKNQLPSTNAYSPYRLRIPVQVERELPELLSEYFPVVESQTVAGIVIFEFEKKRLLSGEEKWKLVLDK